MVNLRLRDVGLLVFLSSPSMNMFSFLVVTIAAIYGCWLDDFFASSYVTSSLFS